MQEPTEYLEEAPLSSRGEPKGPPMACLFVASLANSTTEESLRLLFAPYGTLLKIKLLRDRSARPYAFVQYSDVEEANAALLNTNGKTLDGRRLRVEKAKVNRTLFIAKLSQISSAQLREIVEKYGPVDNVTIIKNHQTNKSKGCGFVKYRFREDAMEAFAGLKTAQKKWVIEWATSANDPDALGVDKLNIFVGGLHPVHVTKENLQERFEDYGNLESVTFVNRTGQLDAPEDTTEPGSRSAYAFLRYSDADSAARAIEQENGAEWFERRIRVQYCESQEMKMKRRQQKFVGTVGQPYNSQFYRGIQMPPVYMQSYQKVPTAMYNPLPMGVASTADGQNNVFAFTYPPILYSNGQQPPWVYSTQGQPGSPTAISPQPSPTGVAAYPLYPTQQPQQPQSQPTQFASQAQSGQLGLLATPGTVPIPNIGLAGGGYSEPTVSSPAEPTEGSILSATAQLAGLNITGQGRPGQSVRW